MGTGTISSDTVFIGMPKQISHLGDKAMRRRTGERTNE
jgi:hypothetical protein